MFLAALAEEAREMVTLEVLVNLRDFKSRPGSGPRFELAQRRPHRGLGNLQLRAQADHPGQLAPPDPSCSRKWAAV